MYYILYISHIAYVIYTLNVSRQLFLQKVYTRIYIVYKIFDIYDILNIFIKCFNISLFKYISVINDFIQSIQKFIIQILYTSILIIKINIEMLVNMFENRFLFVIK